MFKFPLALRLFQKFQNKKKFQKYDRMMGSLIFDKKRTEFIQGQ